MIDVEVIIPATNINTTLQSTVACLCELCFSASASSSASECHVEVECYDVVAADRNPPLIPQLLSFAVALFCSAGDYNIILTLEPWPHLRSIVLLLQHPFSYCL